MADSYSDTSGLSAQDQETVRRLRADFAAQQEDPDAAEEEGLPPEKQDFPIGIRPDGSVNLVSGPDEE